MHADFATAIDALHESFQALIGMTPVSAGHLPGRMPQQGVYLFTEGGRHLYVGRSNNIRGRYARHCLPGATHRMAAFAFHLAREITGNTRASYRKGASSRAGLMLDADFAS